MSNSLKIPLFFLVAGICWALFSDPVISYFTKNMPVIHQDMYRSLNDFIFVFIIAIILYFEIGKQQRKLKRSKEEYWQLFESNPNPMWIYNNESLRFVMVNDAAIEKYAYSRNEFLKMTIKNIRPDGEYEKLDTYISNHNDGIRMAGVWKHIRGTGEMMDVSVISHPVLFNNEHCNMVMATDVTEFLDKETKLQDSYQQIKVSNETLLHVAWSNSHELRKPLCSILGLIGLLKNSPDEKELEECLNMLEVCSIELDKVVKQNNEKLSKIQL